MPRALVRMIAIHLSRIWQDQKITPAFFFFGWGYRPSCALGLIIRSLGRPNAGGALLARLVLIDALGEIIAKRIIKVINELSGQRS